MNLFKSFTHCRTYSGVNFVTFYVIFVYFSIVFVLFYLFTYFHFFHFFPVSTCKYILTLKKAKAESTLSLIYSCTVNGLIPLYNILPKLLDLDYLVTYYLETITEHLL